MPKKRRQAHIPQQTTRKRKTQRRPDFGAAPQPRTEREPVFADTPAVAVPLGDVSGPVETRPHRVSQAERMPGRRRVEQLRRARLGEQPSGRYAAAQLPQFDRRFVMNEMRRIAIISVALFAVIVVLALIIR